MSGSSTNLVVPIYVKAMCVGNPDNQIPFAGGGADFSRLPYRRGDKYADPEANISEYLETQPFEGDSPRDVGIHLHWALPNALTRGKANPDGGQVDFPAVPNRWLVIRIVDSDSNRNKAWVIESDYLSKTLLDAKYSITVPVEPSESDPQPYRYMGKVFDYDQWRLLRQSNGPDSAEYYKKLTAIGPGDHTFASYYPNCTNVFGLYDAMDGMDDKEGCVTYRVVGWYSESKNDPMFIYNKDLKKEFKWDFSDKTDEKLSNTLFVGEVSNIGWKLNQSYYTLPPQGIKVAIGNTPVQVFSAFMAHQLSETNPDPEKLLFAERLLDALQTGLLPEFDRLGGLEKLEYQLQQNSFRAIQGGHIWLVKKADGQDKPAKELPDNLKELKPKWEKLWKDFQDNLNILRQEYDTLFEEKVFKKLEQRQKQLEEISVGVRNNWSEAENLGQKVDLKSFLTTLLKCLNEALAEKFSNYLSSRLKGFNPLETLWEELGYEQKFDEFWRELINEPNQLEQKEENLFPPIVEELNQLEQQWTQLVGQPKQLKQKMEQGFAELKKGLNQLKQQREQSLVQRIDSLNQLRQKLYDVKSEEIAHALNELNDRQQQYDRQWDEIQDLRWQIFADWYKYMVAEYATESNHLEKVTIDDITYFIRREIELLNKKVEETGKLTFNDPQTNSDTRSSTGEQANQQVLAEAQIDPKQLPEENTLAGKVVEKLRDLHKKLLQLQVIKKSDSDSTSFVLQVGLASRYWLPNEPVILLSGDESFLNSSNRYGQKDSLTCQVKSSSEFDSSSIQNIEKNNIVNEVNVLFKDLDNFGKNQWKENPRIPLLLQWEVEYRPVRKMNDYDGYRHDTVTAAYNNHEDYLDLRYNNEISPRGRETYSGSTILTARATNNLKQVIETYLEHNPKPDGNSPSEEQEDKFLGELETLKQQLPEVPVLTQALGGFNSAMIMRKQTLRLPVGDPIAATPGLDEFSNKLVKDAVDRFNTHAPMPDNYYNPIRGGFMAVSKLRLIDAFGQIQSLNTDNIIRAESMISPEDTNSQPEHIFLAPRFTQPTRLQFLWLSAEHKDEVEMNSHPASSPICGWILPNYLDNSLLFYDNKGQYIGYIILSKDKKKEIWHSAPGREEKDIRAAFAHTNSHLRDFAVHVYNDGINRGFMETFLQVSDRALDNINPQNHRQHQQMAVLMGRPLALVRASLKLELKGLPAAKQSWESFASDVRSGNLEHRDTKDFIKVKVPVRLGDTLNINDGLVGYFRDDAPEYQTNYQFFYAPMAEKTREILHPQEQKETMYILHPQAHTIELDADPKSHPLYVTMIIDPRAKVHATTAMLPVQALEIPPDQYEEALKAMEVSFLGGPILSPPDKVAFPVPTESSGEWTWVQKQDLHTWKPEQKIGNVDDRAKLSPESLAIIEGWLEMRNAQ